MDKSNLKLDIHNLDQACLEQAELYEEAGRMWATAVSEKDSIENQLELKKAHIDEEVRKDPKKFGLPEGSKPTETWTANRVLSHEEVQAIQEELLEARKNERILAIRKTSIEQRLKALSLLVDLYKGSYFAVNTKIFTEKEVQERRDEEFTTEQTNHPKAQKLILTRKKNKEE